MAAFTVQKFMPKSYCFPLLSQCWYCGKEIDGYVFHISGNECDIGCANQQIKRSRDILGVILGDVDSFVGYGLGFDKPEFFWYVFVESQEALPSLREEFSAAQLGFSIYPLITEIPVLGEPEMIPAIPEKFVQGGTSIGHLRAGTTGTLGGIMRIGEKRYALATASIIAPEGSRIGDSVVHPSIPDSPKRGIIMGKLSAISRMIPNTSNDMDAALVEIFDDIKTSPWIKNLGRPGDLSEPHIGMTVRKSGRSTGFTEGKILCTDVKMKVVIRNKLYFLQDHFLAISEMGSFAETGDEGSFILDNRNSVTGLLEMVFHGMAVCSRASLVFERFGLVPPYCFEFDEEEADD